MPDEQQQQPLQPPANLLVSGTKAYGPKDRDDRPWGWWATVRVAEVDAAGNPITPEAGNHPAWAEKVIFILPGARLSLQRHFGRKERWRNLSPSNDFVAVVENLLTGELVEYVVGPNQEIHVPCTAQHRMWNKGTTPVVVYERQEAAGVFLACREDDNDRTSDDYGRA